MTFSYLGVRIQTFRYYTIIKIDIFLLFIDQNNKFIKKANMILNKSKNSLKNIKTKIYINKIYTTSFYIIFL